jgi:redox-sensitive bicupin YhaK (pirin superfamily)
MNNQTRRVTRIVTPQTVMEGAGVKLIRSIATRTLDHVDPFLLFDHFGSKDPADYIKGFPMHPHRGIETVTYMISGHVNHKDSIGNSGSITDGDVQWMTSGRGIMHEEMPIPEIRHKDGVKIRVIAGEVDGVRGPVKEIVAEPTYLDISIPPDGTFSQSIVRGHAAFAYVFEGEGIFETGGAEAGKPIFHPRLIVFGDGDQVSVRAADPGARFLLVSGKPLNEPIARWGPFVMNTQEEIEQTLEEIKNGTFINSG